jgi:ornithine carbamoyltransferase
VQSRLSIPSHCLSPGEPLRASHILAIFAAARRLRTAAKAGTVGKPLRGKNIALLIGTSSEGENSALHGAALELGAHVAEVRFTEPAESASSDDDIRTLARMLGRMYDAIDCGTMPSTATRQMEREAGVPVYQGLGMDDHPARALADLMALREHRPPTATRASILFLGDPRTLRGRAFLSAAREIGFEVEMGSQWQAPSNDATCVVDATDAAHWSLFTPSGPVDQAGLSANHRFVMQTVLLDTIADG